ncbi:MAG TPA: DUF58 domain-containing protein [Terriglobales bacterium]|nr:DUF58 domain-containing protein [Terriglobales bacterium]
MAGDETQLRQAIESSVDAVLDPAFLQRIDRLRLRARATRSLREGENPTAHAATPSGSELEAHRPYYPGDDLRRVDWNAYGRLDQLIVRLYRAEREAPHHLLIDSSASMAFPPDDRKLPFAAALVTALAYAAVRNHDPVRLLYVGSAHATGYAASPRIAHLRQMPLVRQWLVGVRPQGEAALTTAVQRWLQTRPTAGVAVIVSDFLMPPAEYEPALGELAARGFETTCVRVLGPAERDPTRSFRSGTVIDAETGERRELHLETGNLARYQAALNRQLTSLAELCARRRIGYAVAETAGALQPELLQRIGRLR